MVDWGKGYITDIEYNDLFHPPMAPEILALAAVLNGFEPPDFDGSLTYCELGCSHGLTSLIFAAVNPKATFHAVDFNPASIAHAEARARAAGLDNITFHERSFQQLSEPSAGLPMFDVIALHGVWSWVAPEQQRAITTFLNSHLKPGGLVYISYNALPAWNETAPLQRVLRELATAQHGRSDQAAANAMTMINHLAEKKIIPPRFNDGLKRLNESGQGRDLTYLVHEYLHTGWAPYYFADVAQALAEAKLSYVGSAKLLDNFWNLALNEEQRALLSDIAASELRETLKDFCTNNWFRRDVFVRGARAMTPAKRQSLLRQLTFALVAPMPDVIEVSGPSIVLRPNPEIYRPILQALERGPRSVGELLSLPGFVSRHMPGAPEVVATLISSGLAYLWRKPSRDAEDTAARLNEVLGDVPFSQGATIAVAPLARGLSLSPTEFALYKMIRRGETPDAGALATHLVGLFREVGSHPIIDGKPIENETEAVAVVTKEVATKTSQHLPIWRALGIVPQ
jgi:SAM-dependent methyltransferase